MPLYETIILIRRLTEKNLLHRSFDGTDLSHLFEMTSFTRKRGSVILLINRNLLLHSQATQPNLSIVLINVCFTHLKT